MKSKIICYNKMDIEYGWVSTIDILGMNQEKLISH